MIIVSDTSAIGNLAIVNRLWLLQIIYSKVSTLQELPE